MTASDVLTGEYETLRAELDAAYSAPEWDSARIDRIADRLAPLEKMLAQRRPGLRQGQAAAPA